MAETFTVEQLREAAQRAAAAGDVAAAKKLIARGKALEAAAGGGAPVAAPAPTPAAGTPFAPEEPGLIDTIMDYGSEGVRRGGYLAQEAARGATNLLGAPVDLINASPMLLNALPGEQGMEPFSERPVMGSEFIWDALTAPRDIVAQDVMGDQGGDLQPKDRFDRVAGRVAQELGAAAIPVGGAVAAAARIGTQGARQMGGFLGRFLEPFAVNAPKAAGKEMAYATAAGAGAGVAREAVSDGDPNTTTTAEAPSLLKVAECQ